jgi:hypothetical protein
MDNNLQAALDQARQALAEGGIPIGWQAADFMPGPPDLWNEDVGR